MVRRQKEKTFFLLTTIGTMKHQSLTKNLLHKFSKKTVLILLSLILLHPFVNFKVRQDWNHGQRMMTLSCMTFSKSVPLWTTYTML